MKSYMKVFSELYDALRRDIISQYPSIERDIEADLSRLRRSMDKEGLSFITITHSSMCDWFQSSLAHGALEENLEIGHARPRGFGRLSPNDARPRYLHGLMSLIFEDSGTLRLDPDVTAISFVRQWLLMAKKVEVTCDNSRTEKALQDYLVVDSSLPDHNPDTWDLDDPIWVRRTGHPIWGPARVDSNYDLFGVDEPTVTHDWGLFRDLCDRVRSLIGVFDPWSCRPKHGPGAVADADGALKYDFKHWPRKLQQYFPWDYFASSDLGLYRNDTGRQPDDVERPSVVLTVPKTQKGPRIICKEPIAHVWIQGALERFLVERVQQTPLSISIDFRNQALSQDDCLSASYSGKVATVDLSNASDRISTRLVEYVFSHSGDTSVLDALHACRSRYFLLDGVMHKFRKFSPAGSACTFPVQTIIFLIISVYSLLRARGLKAGDWLQVLHSVRVFGDDIIVPADAYPILVDTMTSLLLKVNQSKSYHTGHFRESCGMDAYHGWDVTPAYVRGIYSSSRPSSLQSVVDASNNLFSRGYWHTAAALLKTVPAKERKLLPVGYQEGGAVSLYSFCGTDVSHLSSRFNEHLQRTEVSALTLTQRVRKVQSDGDAGLVQFFNEEPDPESLYSSGQALRPTSTKTRRWV